MQKTVFCDPKHISFANQTFQLFNLSTFQLLKDICFTREKRKKIPTEIVNFLSGNLIFINRQQVFLYVYELGIILYVFQLLLYTRLFL